MEPYHRYLKRGRPSGGGGRGKNKLELEFGVDGDSDYAYYRSSSMDDWGISDSPGKIALLIIIAMVLFCCCVFGAVGGFTYVCDLLRTRRAKDEHDDPNVVYVKHPIDEDDIERLHSQKEKGTLGYIFDVDGAYEIRKIKRDSSHQTPSQTQQQQQQRRRGPSLREKLAYVDSKLEDGEMDESKRAHFEQLKEKVEAKLAKKKEQRRLHKLEGRLQAQLDAQNEVDVERAKLDRRKSRLQAKLAETQKQITYLKQEPDIVLEGDEGIEKVAEEPDIVVKGDHWPTPTPTDIGEESQEPNIRVEGIYLKLEPEMVVESEGTDEEANNIDAEEDHGPTITDFGGECQEPDILVEGIEPDIVMEGIEPDIVVEADCGEDHDIDSNHYHVPVISDFGEESPEPDILVEGAAPSFAEPREPVILMKRAGTDSKNKLQEPANISNDEVLTNKHHGQIPPLQVDPRRHRIMPPDSTTTGRRKGKDLKGPTPHQALSLMDVPLNRSLRSNKEERQRLSEQSKKSPYYKPATAQA